MKFEIHTGYNCQLDIVHPEQFTGFQVRLNVQYKLGDGIYDSTTAGQMALIDSISFNVDTGKISVPGTFKPVMFRSLIRLSGLDVSEYGTLDYSAMPVMPMAENRVQCAWPFILTNLGVIVDSPIIACAVRIETIGNLLGEDPLLNAIRGSGSVESVTGTIEVDPIYRS